MRPGGGRAKGNAFEREIARDIVTEFAPYGIGKEDCYRTPLSGGHRFARAADPGDLVISERLRKFFPFVVECKRDRRFQLWHFLRLDKKEKWIEKQWLDQALRQAEAVPGCQPLLIVRKDREPAWAITPGNTARLRFLTDFATFSYATRCWVVLPWEDVLKYGEPKCGVEFRGGGTQCWCSKRALHEGGHEMMVT